MSQLTADQKYQIAMRLISVVESMLAIPKLPAQTSVAVQQRPLKDAHLLDPEVENMISSSAASLLKAIEDMPVDEISGVTSDGL